MQSNLADIPNAKMLDYVSAWYVKSLRYMKDTQIRCGLVSTNSITQGEQVGILWGWMLNTGAKIFFAHRTFPWSSEARGSAAVHCVIVGFSNLEIFPRWIFDYQDGKTATAYRAGNINPYLIDGPNIVAQSRKVPICGNAPKMTRGSQPTDGGNLLLSEDERSEVLRKEPSLAPWIRPFLMGDDFINNGRRFCFWIENCPPGIMRGSPEISQRLAAIKATREKSTKESTRNWAKRPNCFTETRQPSTHYLAIPRVSSERRTYIPIGYMRNFVRQNSL